MSGTGSEAGLAQLNDEPKQTGSSERHGDREGSDRVG